MLSEVELAERLRVKMGDVPYKTFNDEIEKIILETDKKDLDIVKLYYDKAFPKFRQHGNKTEIKVRDIILTSDLQLFKLNSPLGKELEESLDVGHLEYEERFEKVVQKGLEMDKLFKETHYSIWIKNQIYHWSPSTIKWRLFGEEETNKQLTFDDWRTSDIYPDTYFTMIEPDELSQMTLDWDKTHQYTLPGDSRSYVDEMVDKMDLLKFGK